MRRLAALAAGVLAVVLLAAPQARAGTLADCLARQHVCVSGEGRGLVSQGQQAQLDFGGGGF